MIRMTGQRIFDVTQTLFKIISEKRALPSKGVYRVTKMHRALSVEFDTINGERSKKIESYEHKVPTVGGVILPSTEENLARTDVVMQSAVPDDKMPEFIAWWKEIASVESDVNIEPIPLDQLGEGLITYAEFGVLDDLVKGD